MQNGWIHDGRDQDGCHHQVEGEWMSEGFFLYKMAETRMAEFKIAAIIKLSLNEWVKVFLMQIVGTNLGKCEWVWEGKLRWLNANWQNSRWLALSSWVRMNEFESDWISLSQILSERVFLSKSQVSECKMTDSNMAEFKMAAIIKLRMNISFFCVWIASVMSLRVSDGSNMAEFKMAAIIKLSENESEWIWCEESFLWISRWNPRWEPSSSWQNERVSEELWEVLCKLRWLNPNGRIQDGCHHQVNQSVESEWMSLSQIELVWVRVLCKMAESKMAEFKMVPSSS